MASSPTPVPTDPAAFAGKVVLFVGNECAQWQPGEFQKAAEFCRAHDIDTLCAKRADGSIRWYGDPARLASEREAVLAAGRGYLPFVYCYGPRFGDKQVHDECAVLAEIMSVNDHGACADLEAEWNGQTEAASLFSSLMRPVPGLLFLTTWADPQVQRFPTHQLAPCVNAWVPQDYDKWLASLEAAQLSAGMTVRFPALDLSGEFGPNDPAGIAAQKRAAGDKSLWLWEYATAQANTALLDEVVKAFKG